MNQNKYESSLSESVPVSGINDSYEINKRSTKLKGGKGNVTFMTHKK